MTIDKAHWIFKQKINRLNSEHYRDLLPIQIDDLLNRGTFWYMEHLGQTHKLPFETTQARMDMLSTLVVKFPEQSELAPAATSDNQYEFRFGDLKYPYAHLVRAYGKCGELVVPVSIVKHDELSKVLGDAFQKPSKKWGKLVGSLGKSTENDTTSALYVHSEEGFVIDKLRIEYIRKPERVFVGGYDSVEYLACVKAGGSDCSNQYLSSSSDKQQCELPELYHELWVDVAVYLYTGRTENPQLLAFTEKKIITQT